MSNVSRPRLPVSTRHAFALAFDLAVRRDPFHSLVVPLLLRAPWILALATLPEPGDHDATLLAVTAVALVGDFVSALLIGAMLRIRARSVFNTPPEVKPMAASACYRAGLARMPWLFATEAMRNFAVALAFVPAAFSGLDPDRLLASPARSLPLIGLSLLLVVPMVFVLYRLGVATEAVVLDEHDLARAFRASYRHMRKHIERWGELIAAGVALMLLPALAIAAVWLAVPSIAWTTCLALLWLVIAGLWPVVQYAWTFFYLRLVEIEAVAAATAPIARALEDIAPPR